MREMGKDEREDGQGARKGDGAWETAVDGAPTHLGSPHQEVAGLREFQNQLGCSLFVGGAGASATILRKSNIAHCSREPNTTEQGQPK